METDTSATAMPVDGAHTKNLPANPQTLSRAFQPALIDRLFARLSAMYGNKFLDMWREVDMDDVKKCWADELRIFSVDHVGVAIDGLKTHIFPPTLPEFLQLCEDARRARPRTQWQPALPEPETSEQEREDARQRLFHSNRLLMEASERKSGGKPSTAWASSILRDHELGAYVPADSLRMAREALKRFTL